LRFSDIRQTLIKGIHAPADNVYLVGDKAVDNPSTPRWVSPYQRGEFLRLGIDSKDIKQPVANRASRRRKGFPRRRIRGVALLAKDLPWKVAA